MITRCVLRDALCGTLYEGFTDQFVVEGSPSMAVGLATRT